jgi:hypothetical protein
MSRAGASLSANLQMNGYDISGVGNESFSFENGVKISTSVGDGGSTTPNLNFGHSIVNTASGSIVIGNETQLSGGSLDKITVIGTDNNLDGVPFGASEHIATRDNIIGHSNRVLLNGNRNTVIGSLNDIESPAALANTFITNSYEFSALGNFNVVIGFQPVSPVNVVGLFDAVGIGNKVNVQGLGTIAIGSQTTALSTYSVAIGANANANGLSAVAIGPYAEATATCAYQIGTGTNNTEESLQFKDTMIVSGGNILSQNLDVDLTVADDLQIDFTGTNYTETTANISGHFDGIDAKFAAVDADITEVAAASGNWDSTYTTVCASSANWDLAYATVSGIELSTADDLQIDFVPTNYTATSANISGHFDGIDTALANAGTNDFCNQTLLVSAISGCGDITLTTPNTASTINLDGDTVFKQDVSFENATLVQNVTTTPYYLTVAVNGSAMAIPLFQPLGGIGDWAIGDDFIVS